MTQAIVPPAPVVRTAACDDVSALDALIAAPVRRPDCGYPADKPTEASNAHRFTVDSELVADGSYPINAADGAIARCGGWHRRPAVVGGDHHAAPRERMFDPARDPARIRAFFVSPDHAPRGGGREASPEASERAACAYGFTTTAPMATPSGVPFYPVEDIVFSGRATLDLGDIAGRFVPMQKPLVADLRR